MAVSHVDRSEDTKCCTKHILEIRAESGHSLQVAPMSAKRDKAVLHCTAAPTQPNNDRSADKAAICHSTYKTM
jgi:hypothetical protein